MKAEAEEQREQLAERQTEKFERLAEYSLDSENKRIYEARADKWHEQSTGISVKTEKERIQDLNRETSKTVFDNYETNRIQHNLNLVPADELRELQVEGVTGYVNFSGLSVQSAEAVSDTFEDLSKEYLSGITQIKTGTLEDFYSEPNAFAYVKHNDRLGEHELILNPRKMKDYDRMCQRIRKLSDDGKIAYIPEGLEGQYVATHEFAHGFLQVGRDVRKDWIGQDLKRINRTRKEIRSIFEEYTQEVHRLEEELARIEADPDFLSDDIEKQMAALERMGEATDRLNAVKISKYSMENADEFMAEAFTQNRIGTEQSKYTDRVMEVLDREYKISAENRNSSVMRVKESLSVVEHRSSMHTNKDIKAALDLLDTDQPMVLSNKYFEERNNDRIRDRLSMELKKLTEQEKEVLERYTGFTAQRLNSAIATGKMNEELEVIMKILDGALEKGEITDDIIVRRLTIPQFMNIPKFAEDEKHVMMGLVGQTLTNDIFTSTTLIPFHYPGRNVIIDIEVPAGYRGALYLRDIAYTKMKHQNEVLFHRGFEYIIDSVEIIDGAYYIRGRAL